MATAQACCRPNGCALRRDTATRFTEALFDRRRFSATLLVCLRFDFDGVYDDVGFHVVSMSLKRKMAEGVGRLLGLYIAPKREVWNVVQRDFLERFLTTFRVDCVFDVGANEGQYAMLVRAAGFKGPIISFEPTPRLAAALRKKAASDPNWSSKKSPLMKPKG